MLGPADVALVTQSSIADGVLISGPLDPAVTVDIKSQVDGTIRDLRVDRGSAVSKGQSLATIEGAGLQAAASAAKAAIASALADQAVADQSYAASQKLYAAGAISELDLKASAAQQRGALARLENARTQADIAEENLKYAMVTSPIAGSVSARAVDEGQAVRKGDLLLTLVDTRMLELKGRIGVDDAAGVRIGQKVTFTLDAAPGKTFDGLVARIDPLADPGTRQVGVYAQLPNGSHQLVAGQYARGRIAAGGTKAQGLAVPSSAVRTATDGSHSVLVISNGRVVKRPVETGAIDQVNGLTIITSGLRQGEQVIAGTAAIADGAAVQLPTTTPGGPPK
jgi:RND family efflux transporter MFP subunit